MWHNAKHINIVLRWGQCILSSHFISCVYAGFVYCFLSLTSITKQLKYVGSSWNIWCYKLSFSIKSSSNASDFFKFGEFARMINTKSRIYRNVSRVDWCLQSVSVNICVIEVFCLITIATPYRCQVHIWYDRYRTTCCGTQTVGKDHSGYGLHQ